MTVGVCAGQVAVIGEPIVFGIGQSARERASNLPYFKVFCGQRCFALRPQDVQVPILTAEVNSPLADSNRR